MAVLIVTEGPEIGKHLDLETHRLVMVGRDASCTFQVMDKSVSRQHLQLKTGPKGNHLAIDFNSSNGVLVNEQKIDAETELKDGDVVRIGSTAMVYMTEKSRASQRVAELAKQTGERFQQTQIIEPPPKK